MQIPNSIPNIIFCYCVHRRRGGRVVLYFVMFGLVDDVNMNIIYKPLCLCEWEICIVLHKFHKHQPLMTC